MNRIVYILVPLFLFLQGCQDDLFERQPLDKISDSDVWKDATMIEAYVTRLYTMYPFNEFPVEQWHNWSDESTKPDGNLSSITTGGAALPDFWDYAYIRDMNFFLERIEDAPVSESLKKRLKGEVKTIRAVVYFEMQKRYGGVPLVDVVLDPYGDIDKKYTIRSTEEAIADFIDSELTAAIELLPEDPTPKTRINKWTAYALKARANLWAGSIAKYGSVQIDGLVGIPAGRAGEFFTKASAAAEAVIASENYSLYNKYEDKSENYRNLFLDESNGEVIFEKMFDGVNIGHAWDDYNGPPTYAGLGGNQNPLLEFILGYENVDGSDVQPTFGPDNLYNNGFEPFEMKDPRLRATVAFQGDPFLNDVYQTYEGLDPSATPDPSAIMSNVNESYNGVPTAGSDSRAIGRRGTQSGFMVKKYVADQAFIPRFQSYVNWIELRLAEIYLIKAEAELELEHPDQAAAALNATRGRAGISLVDASTSTLGKLRNERKYELAFEVHRIWDLRRWRIAEDVLNNQQFTGLRIILHYESGKYYFLPMNAEGFTRVFRPEQYYNPIGAGRISNNPDLVENPFY